MREGLLRDIEGTFLDFSYNNGLEMSSEISAHFNCLHYDDILHLSYTFNAGHFIVRALEASSECRYSR